MLVLTQEEAEAVVNNGNTNKSPRNGYIFNGTVPKGTPFLKGDANNDGTVSVADAVMLQNWLIDSGDLTNSRNSDLCEDKRINSFDFVILRRMIIENNSLSTQ